MNNILEQLPLDIHLNISIFLNNESLDIYLKTINLKFENAEYTFLLKNKFPEIYTKNLYKYDIKTIYIKLNYIHFYYHGNEYFINNSYIENIVDISLMKFYEDAYDSVDMEDDDNVEEIIQKNDAFYILLEYIFLEKLHKFDNIAFISKNDNLNTFLKAYNMNPNYINNEFIYWILEQYGIISNSKIIIYILQNLEYFKIAFDTIFNEILKLLDDNNGHEAIIHGLWDYLKPLLKENHLDGLYNYIINDRRLYIDSKKRLTYKWCNHPLTIEKYSKNF